MIRGPRNFTGRGRPRRTSRKSRYPVRFRQRRGTSSRSKLRGRRPGLLPPASGPISSRCAFGSIRSSGWPAWCVSGCCRSNRTSPCTWSRSTSIRSVCRRSWISRIPRDFAGELARRAGPLRDDRLEDHHESAPRRGRGFRCLSRRRPVRPGVERAAADGSRWSDDSWRLLMAVFLFPDRIQHMLYRFADPGAPEPRPGTRACATGGVSPIPTGTSTASSAMSAIGGRAAGHALPGRFRSRFSFLPQAVQREHLARPRTATCGRPGTRESAGSKTCSIPRRSSFQGVDWGRTSAFALGLSGIYLNQREGREPEGIGRTRRSERDRAHPSGSSRT